LTLESAPANLPPDGKRESPVDVNQWSRDEDLFGTGE